MKNKFSKSLFRLNLIVGLSRLLMILLFGLILLTGCKNDISVILFAEGDINFSMKNYETINIRLSA